MSYLSSRGDYYMRSVSDKEKEKCLQEPQNQNLLHWSEFKLAYFFFVLSRHGIN